MSRISIEIRNERRKRREAFSRPQREQLKKLAQEAYSRGEIPWEVQKKLQKLPRNTHFTRVTRRCRLCGRPRGVFRRFGMCRLCLRKYAMQGYIPGLVKSSW